MKKQDLKTKVEVAWMKATGQSNGWEVWTDMVYKNSYDEIARKFIVSQRTVKRWHDEYKLNRVA